MINFIIDIFSLVQIMAVGVSFVAKVVVVAAVALFPLLLLLSLLLCCCCCCRCCCTLLLYHRQPNVMVACAQAHVAQARDCIVVLIQLYNPSPAPHVPVRRQP